MSKCCITGVLFCVLECTAIHVHAAQSYNRGQNTSQFSNFIG